MRVPLGTRRRGEREEKEKKKRREREESKKRGRKKQGKSNTSAEQRKSGIEAASSPATPVGGTVHGTLSLKYVKIRKVRGDARVVPGKKRVRPTRARLPTLRRRFTAEAGERVLNNALRFWRIDARTGYMRNLHGASHLRSLARDVHFSSMYILQKGKWRKER